jgi:hypothetical protein
MLGGSLVAGCLRPEPSHLGQRAVERPDDVGHGDLLGWSGQTVAPVGSPLAPEQAGPAEVVEDALEELGR